MANNEVSIKLNIGADISAAEKAISGLAGSMKNVKLSPSQMGGLTTIEQKVKDILGELKGFDNVTLAPSDMKKVDKLYAELNKEVERLASTYNTLKASQSSGALKDLIPKTQFSSIQQARKEIEEYSKSASKLEEANKVLKTYQSQLAGSGTKFNLTGKTGGEKPVEVSSYKELLAVLKSLGLEADKLPSKFGDIKKIFNDIDSKNLTETIENVNKLTGLNLDPTTTSVEQLKIALADYAQGAAGKSRSQTEGVNQAINALNGSLNRMSPELTRAAQAMDEMTSREKEFERLSQSVASFFGIQNMVNLFRRSVREAINVVQELDEAMTATAVVTDFSVDDMWDSLPTYQKMANELGVTIKDVYEASTLYYQQGLNTKQVMEVTNQTLQMARIAGIEAAEATDMMTAALRGFNMEVNEANAQKVNDIFSELAAITASDTQELGTALEKTASIANSAGMSIEVTTALLAQAIEATREAPENIGTAMKTIIARFQELKKNPLTISEVDGEMVDFNKVDTALKTIGIDLVESSDNFKNLDEVLLEISSRWDGLTQTQRRYIATIVAGSRQQSRFIAMMGDNARLTDLVSHAYDSAGAAARQYEKTQQSLETAFNRLKNAWDTFLMGIANNKIIKAAAGLLEGIISVADKIFSVLGKIPGAFGDVTQSVAQLVAAIAGLKGARTIINGVFKGLAASFSGKSFGDAFKSSFLNSFAGMRKNAGTGILGTLFAGAKNPKDYFKNIVSSVKEGISNKDVNKTFAKMFTFNPFDNTYINNQSLQVSNLADATKQAEEAAKGAAGGFTGFAKSIGAGGWIAIAVAGITALVAIIQKFYKTAKQKVEARDDLFSQYEEKIDDLKKSETSIRDLEGEFKSLASGVDEYGKNIGLSADEYSRYNEIVDELVKISPEIVQGYNNEGQAIVDKNTAIEKSIELLEKQKELEEAEFYSPQNIKTALQGYEGDLQLLQDDINKAAKNGAFLLPNADEFGNVSYGNFDLKDLDKIDLDDLKNIENIDQRQKALQSYNLLQGYKGAVDKIAAQQANYLMGYADFLEIPKALGSNMASSYQNILKSMVKNEKINSTNATEQLYKALDLTKRLEGNEEYTKAVKDAENAKKAFNDSNKDNSDIRQFNKEIKASAEYLDKLAEKQREADNEFQADAIQAQADALRDYRKEVFSVTNALNPLASAYTKAKSAADDLAESLGNAGDYYSAQDAMAANLSTVLDADRDDYGNISKLGKNESGHGSQSFWKVAEATIGRENLTKMGYDINKVDNLMYMVSKMMEGSQAGFDEFSKFYNTRKSSLSKEFQGTSLKEVLPYINTQEKLEEFAKELGLSTDAVAAMTSAARQFTDKAVVNFNEVRQSYREDENTVDIGDIASDKDTLIVSEDRLYDDMIASGWTPDMWDEYLKAAHKQGIQTFTDEESYLKAYGGAVTSAGEQKNLVEFLQDAIQTGQFDKDQVKVLGEKFLETADNWAQQPDGITKDDLDGIIETLETDESLDTVDVIRDDVGVIKTLLAAIAGNEGIYTDEQAKEVDEGFDRARGMVETVDLNSYQGEERDKKIAELVQSYGELKNRREELQTQLSAATKAGRTADAERLQGSIAKSRYAINAFNEVLKDGGVDAEKALDELNSKVENGADNIGKITEKSKVEEKLDFESGKSTVQANGEQKEVLKLAPQFNSQEAANLINEIQYEVDEAGEVSVTARIGADNEEATYKIDETGQLLQEIDGKTSVVNINGDNSVALQAIQGTLNSLAKIPAGIKTTFLLQGKLDAKAQAMLAVIRKYGGAVAQQIFGKEGLQVAQALAAAAQTANTDNIDRNNVVYGNPGTLNGPATAPKSGSDSGGGDSDKDKDEKFGDSLSKFYNLLQKIVSYEQRRDILEARFQRSVIQAWKKYSNAKVLSQNLADQRKALQSTIKVQQQIVNNGKSIYKTVVAEVNKRLQKVDKNAKISDYFTIDYDNKLIQVTKKGLAATGDIADILKDFQSTMEDFFGEIHDAEVGIEDNTREMYEIIRQMYEYGGEYANQIKDGVIEFRQDSIDRLSQVNETISETNQKILDKTKESIDLQRQNRENEKARQSLEDKRTRLSLLMQDTQGGHRAEIIALQKELADETLSYQDTLVDQKLDAITKANEKAQEQRERQIDLLQAQLDWSQDTGYIWHEVYKLFDESFDKDGNWLSNSTAAKYQRHGQGYAQMNKYDQATQWDKNRDTGIQAGAAAWSLNDIKGSTLYDRVKAGTVTNGQSMTLNVDGKKVTGTLYTNRTKDGTYIAYNGVQLRDKDLQQVDNKFNEYNVTTKNLKTTDKAEAGLKQGKSYKQLRQEGFDIITLRNLAEKKEGVNGLKKIIPALKESDFKGSNKATLAESLKKIAATLPYGTGKVAGLRNVLAWAYNNKALTNPIKFKGVDGSLDPYGLIYYNYHDSVRQWDVNTGTNKLKNSYNTKLFETYSKEANAKNIWREYRDARKWHKDTYKKYKTGGLAEYTGPAWLDGTPSKPELVLNQTDTQNFLQLKDILASVMKYNGLKSEASGNTDNSTSNYEININVDKVSSDYDVDQIANRVQKIIMKNASYRNTVKVTRTI